MNPLMAEEKPSAEGRESARNSRSKNRRTPGASFLPKRQALLVGSLLCALGAAASGLLAMENFLNEDHPSMAASYILPVLTLVFLFAGLRLFRLAGR